MEARKRCDRVDMIVQDWDRKTVDWKMHKVHLIDEFCPLPQDRFVTASHLSAGSDRPSWCDRALLLRRGKVGGRGGAIWKVERDEVG